MPAPTPGCPSTPTNKSCSISWTTPPATTPAPASIPSETLLAHFDFLSRAFQAHGLPLALYVDYHSFFFTHIPDAFTQLGAALHFYGVALRYAPTPQAKGKIEPQA